MKIELNGRTAVVTGGYGAIGAAMCKKLAGAGANIVVVGRNKDKGVAFEKELKSEGASAAYIHGDVTDKQSMEDMCAGAIARFGRIDILVNNAGINVGADRRGPDP